MRRTDKKFLGEVVVLLGHALHAASAAVLCLVGVQRRALDIASWVSVKTQVSSGIRSSISTSPETVSMEVRRSSPYLSASAVRSVLTMRLTCSSLARMSS